MPVNERGIAPTPGPTAEQAVDDAVNGEPRGGPDLARYASLAEFPPCRCGAAVCPDGRASPEGAAPADGIRERVRQTNAMRAKYRL
ncbi:hypothetical protein ACWD7Y_19000 [Streptomyces drozdowiczii]